MGLGRDLLQEIIDLKRAHALVGMTRVIEIGAQQLSNEFLRADTQLREACELFGSPAVPALGGPIDAGWLADLELQAADAPASQPFWEALGFEYAAIDFDGHRNSYPLDLNKDSVPEKLCNRFDLAVNAGTTEHVANQDNAFRVMHDLVRKGGIMIHDLPAAGMLTHGLVTYTMKFFWHLARENDYEVLRLEMTPGGAAPLPANIIATNARYGRKHAAAAFDGEPIRDWAVRASLRKVTNSAFVTPLDLPPEVMPAQRPPSAARTMARGVGRLRSELGRMPGRIASWMPTPAASPGLAGGGAGQAAGEVAAAPADRSVARPPAGPSGRPGEVFGGGSPAEVLGPPYDADKAAAFVTALEGEKPLAAFIDFVVTRLLPRDHRSIFWGDRMLTIDKSAGFLEEPGFRAAFDQIRGSHQYDQYGSPFTIAWRLHTLVWAARTALALPDGDFVECGVFKGDMAWLVGEVTGLGRSGRQFHLYDSFQGFDPEQTTDADFPDLPGFLGFANAIYAADGLWEGVQARFRELPHFHLHKGYLPGTLDRDGFPDRIAYLHIDLNVAKVEIACLDRLFDRVVPGGVIVFDDYGWKAYRSQKLAEDAFFAERGYQVLELPTGQGLVVRR